MRALSKATHILHGFAGSNVSVNASPTDIVWLIGRTQTNGSADYPTVHRLQDGLHLRSLQDWQNGIEETAGTGKAAGTSTREGSC